MKTWKVSVSWNVIAEEYIRSFYSNGWEDDNE